MVFHHFFKGNNCHSFLFANLYKRWSVFMRLGSRRSKFFYFVLSAIKDEANRKSPNLFHLCKNGGKYGSAPHVGPLSCLESRKVFTEVLVMIYFYVKYCAADC